MGLRYVTIKEHVKIVKEVVFELLTSPPASVGPVNSPRPTFGFFASHSLTTWPCSTTGLISLGHLRSLARPPSSTSSNAFCAVVAPSPF